ncbi:MAG: ParB/RepB/Spo0J family partition protein [Zoogloeaceae bacterium]|jgi:ParB family chromosome partitioning protein|nr:ParB/RepB/Spo0J family partition protein [Zoogloeaceae bacterium]
MNAMKMRGLGRGLDALLSGPGLGKTADELRNLPVASLKPGKYQPRTKMDEASLEELAASIRAQGIVQPILARPIEDDEADYEIIAGERRWRAAQKAGLAEVPVFVREIADEQALAMSLIENIQRENLNPLEEAQGLQRLIEEFALTHQEAADAVGRSRPAASNLLRLLQLAAPVQDLLMENRLDMGHARALLPLAADMQVRLAQVIVQKGLTVRQAERLVAQALVPAKVSAAPRVDADLLRLEEELADALGAAVKIQVGRKGGGQIRIEFSDPDALEGLLAQLRRQTAY